MSDSERLADRLAAVERAVTDGETDLAALEDAAARADRIEVAETRLADLEERVADLEAATDALRGYVGTVRAVNDEVERRADLALDTAERALAGRTPAERPSGEPHPANRPLVDAELGAGWRDAADGEVPDPPEADDSTDRSDGSDSTGRSDGSGNGEGDRSDDGDLRAAVRRLREAL